MYQLFAIKQSLKFTKSRYTSVNSDHDSDGFNLRVELSTQEKKWLHVDIRRSKKTKFENALILLIWPVWNVFFYWSQTNSCWPRSSVRVEPCCTSTISTNNSTSTLLIMTLWSLWSPVCDNLKSFLKNWLVYVNILVLKCPSRLVYSKILENLF